MSALGALLGAGVGLGLVLCWAGWHGTVAPRERRVPLRPRVEGATLRLGLGAGAAVLIGALTGWPVGALLGGLAGFGLPRLFDATKGRAEALSRIEAVAAWAEMLRDTMAGAAGLEQAIVATAPVAPLALRAEITTLAARLESERLAPALRAFADEVGDPTMDLVVAALVLAAEHQASRLGELLGSLAQAARDQATMRLRVEAGRARSRTSVKVVVGVTAGLAFGLVLLNRTYLAPYGTALGQLVLLLVGAMFTAAFVWLSRMTRPSAPQRFLATGLAGRNDSAAFDGSRR